MRTTLAVLFCLLAQPALAWNFCNFPPPRMYDYEPTVPYHVQFWDAEALMLLCYDGRDVPIERAGGCVREKAGRWTIRVRDGLGPTETACLIRHERAHINGWKHRRREGQPDRFAGDYVPLD